MAAPFIGEVDVKQYLATGQIEEVLLQAFKSGLSFKGKDIDFKLTNPEPGFFDIEAYTPFFREHCKTCGSRMTCNGCSNCGNCE